MAIDRHWASLDAALHRRGFHQTWHVRRHELLHQFDRLLDGVHTVGFGGSVTTRALDLPQRCREKGCTVLDHWEAPASDRHAIRRAQLTADLFVTSVNAITRDGIMVNADGIGNRVAASIFGPGQVIFIITPNKLVTSLDAAFQRIRNQATPLNARRLGVQTPCSTDQRCRNCLTDQKMDRVFTFFEYQPIGTAITIFLLDEPLGY